MTVFLVIALVVAGASRNALDASPDDLPVLHYPEDGNLSPATVARMQHERLAEMRRRAAELEEEDRYRQDTWNSRSGGFSRGSAPSGHQRSYGWGPEEELPGEDDWLTEEDIPGEFEGEHDWELLDEFAYFGEPAEPDVSADPDVMYALWYHPSWDRSHDFTGLPMTEDGWTDLTAMYQHPDLYLDSRIMFVSSSEGDDATGLVYMPGDAPVGDDPFSVADGIQPFATIAEAYQHARDGFPDIVLLKRGDEWTENFDNGGAGRIKSGRSIIERSIIAPYGTGDRPKLFRSVIDARDAHNAMVTGIHSYDTAWQTAGRALDITGSVSQQLYEDMRFDRKSTDKIQGGTPGSSDIYNVCIRRCFYSHYQAHDGFFYVARVDGLLFEENVFAEPWQKSYPDESQYGRTLYLSPSGFGDDKNALKNVTLRRNIVFRAERGAVDARCGGLMDNNLFIGTNGSAAGGNGGSRESLQSAHVVNNVFLRGSPNTGGNNNMHFRGIDGGSIVGNIWTDSRGIFGSNNVLNFSPMASADQFKVLRNVLIADNIVYNYDASGSGRAIDIVSTYATIDNVVVDSNDFQFNNGSDEIIRHGDWAGSDGDRFGPFRYSNNRYYSPNDSFSPGADYVGWIVQSGEISPQFTQVTYPDPGRTIGSYMESLGLQGAEEEFAAHALSQSRQDWDPAFSAGAVNDYIRAGFGR